MRRIVIEFPDDRNDSADMIVNIEGCNLSHIAAAAWRLEMAAQDIHMQQQAASMMKAQMDRSEAIEVARSIPAVLGRNGGRPHD